MRHTKLVCFIIAAAAAIGCGKKSAEDLERDWNATEQNAQKYASKYPTAKPLIDDLTKQAKADFDEAKKADEKSRPDKMAVALDRLSKPLDMLKTYETEVDKLDALLNDKTLMGSLSAADFKPLDQQSSAAKKKACCILQPNEKACSDLQGTCGPAPALANMGDLDAKLESAVNDIKEAEKALEAKKPKPAAPAGSGSAGSAGSGSAKK